MGIDLFTMRKMNRVLCLPKYDQSGASSRVRFYKHFNYIENSQIDVRPLFNEQYLKYTYNNSFLKHISALICYLRRMSTLLKLLIFRNFDTLWIQNEALPFIPYIFEKWIYKMNLRVVVDYDDPVFYRYDKSKSKIVRYFLGGKILKIMKEASCVTVSSKHMENFALANSGNTEILLVPPSVDLAQYNKTKSKPHASDLTIGWIGSPSTFKFLKTIESVLVTLQDKHKYKLVIIGAAKDQTLSKLIDCHKLDWSEDLEQDMVRSFDIGIMPLDLENLYAIARDSYKLIMYMASNIPFVTSCNEDTESLVQKYGIGLVAHNKDDWITHLSTLMESASTREKISMKSKGIVERHYSTRVVGEKIDKILIGW
jgi:glycosyltransferase involved in cell wall biosynthesis